MLPPPGQRPGPGGQPDPYHPQQQPPPPPHPPARAEEASAGLPAAPAVPAAPSPKAPAPRRSYAPRGSKQLTRAERAISPAEEASFAVIEKELGGRPALVQILAGADLNQDEALVVGMMADPENDVTSLAKVCIRGGFSLQRLQKLFGEAALARGQVKARARIAERLPDVAAAVMDDAIPGMRTCPTCDGLTTVPAPTTEDPHATAPCGQCKGKGLIPFRPEHEVQKTALQLGGMLTKGSGTTIVNQNLNANTGGGSGGFDKLMSGLDAILYGNGRDRQLKNPHASDSTPDIIEGDVTE